MLNLKPNEIVTLTAEDDSTINLEFMASLEYEGCTYAAFYPELESEDDVLDEDYDIVILKVTEMAGGTGFDMIEDPELEDTLGDMFMDLIYGEM